MYGCDVHVGFGAAVIQVGVGVGASVGFRFPLPDVLPLRHADRLGHVGGSLEGREGRGSLTTTEHGVGATLGVKMQSNHFLEHFVYGQYINKCFFSSLLFSGRKTYGQFGCFRRIHKPHIRIPHKCQ